jgi:signal transduction histidine kinase
MSITGGRTAVAAALALFAAFTVASQSRGPGESPATSMLFAVAFLPMYWMAAWLAWRASRTPALDSAGRRAWELIAIANALLGVGNAVFFVNRHIGSLPGHDALVSFVIPILWFIAMFAALARLRRAARTRLERAAFWLDAVTVFFSGLLILLYVFAHTPGRSSFTSAFATVGTIVYPALDGAVLFAAMVVMLRPGKGVSRSAVALLAASVAVTVVSDLAYGRAAAIGAHRPGIWYEPLYLLASVFAVASAQAQRERPGSEGSRQFEIGSTSSSLVPYVAVLGAVLSVILEVGTGWRTPAGRLAVGTVILTGLVMARQLISRRHVDMLAAAEQVRLTRQAALEVQLQQAHRLEALGLLAGGIAHDFNNLLMTIRASAELASTPAPSSQLEEMQDILSAVDHGASLTRQLLAFGRRDAVQLQRFDLREVVRDMDRVLRRLMTGEIDLRVTLPERAVLVEMDRGQIEQVLLNLTINARDAMPDGGTLDIRVGTTTVDATTTVLAAGSYASLVVSDTGHGMPPEVSARIFEPFYTTKSRGRGSGLGLSTVYAIVSRTGGTIDVSSTEARGTTFEILLPMPEATDAEPEDALPSSSAEPGNAAGREVVLLVDDELTIRETVGRYLARLGYLVVPVADPAEALMHLSSPSRRVDLLLTDLTMPGMSGRTLIERARALDRDLRVICMSGYAEREATATGEVAPLANYIEKPFSLSTLARLVRSTLDTPPE